MSLRTALAARVMQQLTGERRLLKGRQKAEARRQNRGEAHTVEVFHEAGDPYSHVLAQVLPALAERYDVRLDAHLVPAPPDWAAPERARLESYSRLDAARLARAAGLQYQDPGSQPPRERLAVAVAALAASLEAGRFEEEAAAIGTALWTGDDRQLGRFASNPEAASRRLAAGDARRTELGHYLGATLHYGGEWYWGLDRLHYLEARLAELGARRDGQPAAPIFAPPISPRPDAAPAGRGARELHFYLSFRSPYTYIVTERVRALADAYGATLRLRFVLPMVMRGLPVPRAKGLYIVKDAAREARRIGVPFGRIADPVGKPVERGYSLLPWAISESRGHAYCLAFMRGVWAEGIDAGSDGGLRTIVETAGLDWSGARERLGNDDWRPEAEANREEMMSLGLWGVPSFRVGSTVAWGQDRLWVVEDAMRGAGENGGG